VIHEPRPRDLCENAAHFDPARHLEAGGDIAPGMSDAKEEGHVSYGFGRRLLRRSAPGQQHVVHQHRNRAVGSQDRASEDESGEFRPLVDGFMDHDIVVLAVLSYERRC
jgi:hypothetical protein